MSGAFLLSRFLVWEKAYGKGAKGRKNFAGARSWVKTANYQIPGFMDFSFPSKFWERAALTGEKSRPGVLLP